MNDSSSRAAPAQRLNRRHFVIGALLAGVSAGSYAALPHVRYKPVDKRAFESWVPDKVGPWNLRSVSGVVLPPPDAMSDRLYDNLVTRVYEMPGAPAVMMLIAYNYRQDGVLQLHRPEICYPAGGYRLSETQPITLTIAPGVDVPANAFSAEGPQRTEQVLYWTRMGEYFPQSWMDQRLGVIKSNLKGDIPDGAMMRVSVIGQDQATALETLRGFLVTFFQATPPALHRILVGASQG